MVFPYIYYPEQGFKLHKTSRRLKAPEWVTGLELLDQQTGVWPFSWMGQPPTLTSKIFLLGAAFGREIKAKDLPTGVQ